MGEVRPKMTCCLGDRISVDMHSTHHPIVIHAHILGILSWCALIGGPLILTTLTHGFV